MSKYATFRRLWETDRSQIPVAVFNNIVHTGITNALSDEAFLKLTYLLRFGKSLNLSNPTTFNEKLQWLKLHDRNPLYTTLVDKYAVKQWVASRIGSEYVVPTYGVWDSFDEIDFDSLPDRFVLKCTHDSGGLVICHDRASLNIDAARKKITQSLKQNFYWLYREWPYKNVPPRIIAEEYLEPTDGSTDLPDYKWFCFSGEAKAMFIATNRFGEGDTKFDFFDMEYRHLPFTNGHPNADETPVKPCAFDEMRVAAEKLSAGFPHVRVDFYETAKGVYFGEMTFSHWAGLVPFDPPEWDVKFGEWIELPRNADL